MIGTGVWDGVDEQWVARNLTDRVASLHAAVLSLRYDEAGDRPEERCRWVHPPRAAILQLTPSRTEPVQLYMWVREADGWHGWITYTNRDPRDCGSWYPAAKLRPADAEGDPVDNHRRRRRG